MNLFNASRDGNFEKVKKLLTAGVPFDWQDPYGYTPLMIAAINGHHEVVELLLNKG